MKRTMLAAMITIAVLICCASSSWAFWPFSGDDQRKTHESLDVVIETGAENAKEVRDTNTKVGEVISKTEAIQKDLRRGLGGLRKDFKKEMAEIKKENIAHNANIKPILIAMLILFVVLAILIVAVVFSRKKIPAEKASKCSICSRTVKPENWRRHLRRSQCKESGEKMGKKVELILA